MLQGYLPHKKTPPPGGRHGALGIVLLWKPTGAMFLMSEVQDRMVARSMKGSDQDTHVLREGQAQPTVAVGGISTADRDCLAAAPPLIVVSLARHTTRERVRTMRRRQSTNQGTTEIRKGELRSGGTFRWFSGAWCVLPFVRHH